MLGIVFTTTEEASHFIQAYTNQRIDNLEEGSPVEVDGHLVVATGPGKIKATLATERLLREHAVEALLITGTCVALSEDLPPGAMFGASFVLEGDRVDLDAPTYPRMPLDCPLDVTMEGTLVTQDHTSQDDDDKSYWERIADARDTTGYAIAYVAAQHGTPCYIAKVASSGHEADTTADQGDQTLDTMSNFLKDALEAPDEWTVKQ